MTTSPNDCNELTQLIGELVDGQLADGSRDRFLQLLRNDPSARNYYLDYMGLHARLQWRYTGAIACETTEDGPEVGHARREVASGEQFAIPSSELLVPDSSLDPPRLSPALGFLSTSLHGTLGCFSEGLPLAYLVATVVTGLGLLIGSLIPISEPEQVTRSSVSPKVVVEPKAECVGRITGMLDCNGRKRD